MIRKISKNEIRERVHVRIRKKLRGTTERPRLAIFRSTAHIYAQVIDDTKGVTLVAASSTEKADTKVTGGNVAAAKAIGKRVAERAKENGISKVVFDRGGYIYHGRAKEDWSSNGCRNGKTGRSGVAEPEGKRGRDQPRHESRQGRQEHELFGSGRRGRFLGARGGLWRR